LTGELKKLKELVVDAKEKGVKVVSALGIRKKPSPGPGPGPYTTFYLKTEVLSCSLVPNSDIF
jgi:hypothetical protein